MEYSLGIKLDEIQARLEEQRQMIGLILEKVRPDLIETGETRRRKD